MLLPSILGFALCFVCLAATTWAWFVVSVTSDSNTIQTTNFDVNVAVTDGTTPVNAVDGIYTLPTGEYTVTLTPTGNATKGFVVVTVAAAQPPSSQMLMLASAGNEERQTTPPSTITAVGTYYTQQLIVDGVAHAATFTIQTSEAVTLTITAHWGEQDDYPNLNATPLTAELTPITDEAQLTNEEEDPVDEDQQEEGAEDEKKDESSSDENNPTDDPENNGEGENTSTDTPAEGEGGQQGGEQQPSEPSTPTDGEGEQTDVSGDTAGGDIGDDTTTGGETPTGTTTPAGGDVPVDPVVTTEPTAQSEGGAPADLAPIE